MKHVNVLIRRDVAAQIPRTVRDHEVPLLRLVHGKSNVTIVSEKAVKEAIDPAAEFERLCRVYGYDARKEAFRAEIIYGVDGRELAELLEADREKVARAEQEQARAEAAQAARERELAEREAALAAREAELERQAQEAAKAAAKEAKAAEKAGKADSK